METQNNITSDVPSVNKIDLEKFSQLLARLKRAKKKQKLSPELIKKQDRARKVKRTIANNSRKINQQKNKHNKFTK